MSLVNPAYANGLKTDALYIDAAVAGAVAKWGDTALDSTIITALAFSADAQTEATYQAAFMAGPLARDKHVIKGQRSDLVAQLVTLTSDRLGYEAGADVFVISAAEDEAGAKTTLTVLKRL